MSAPSLTPEAGGRKSWVETIGLMILLVSAFGLIGTVGKTDLTPLLNFVCGVFVGARHFPTTPTKEP